jgi:uncharacterized protein
MKRRSISVITCAILVAVVASLSQRQGRAADKADPERKPKATFEVYQDKAGEYRWRLRAQNTKILATAGDGYKEKRSCLAAIESVKRDVVDAPVVEQPPQTAKNPEQPPESKPHK